MQQEAKSTMSIRQQAVMATIQKEKDWLRDTDISTRLAGHPAFSDQGKGRASQVRSCLNDAVRAGHVAVKIDPDDSGRFVYGIPVTAGEAGIAPPMGGVTETGGAQAAGSGLSTATPEEEAIERVEGWKTPDGQVFWTREEALDHARELAVLRLIDGFCGWVATAPVSYSLESAREVATDWLWWLSQRGDSEQA